MRMAIGGPVARSCAHAGICGRATRRACLLSLVGVCVVLCFIVMIVPFAQASTGLPMRSVITRVRLRFWLA